MIPNCKACTKDLLKKCTDRHPVLWLIFEPMSLVMRAWAFLLAIKNTRADKPECNGCTKLLKMQLKIRSAIFYKLNEIIDPWFDKLVKAMS